MTSNPTPPRLRQLLEDPVRIVAFAGAAVTAVALLWRSLFAVGEIDATLLGPAATAVAIAVFVAIGPRWTVLAGIPFAAAALLTAGRSELSFNLERPEETGWFVYAIVVLFSVATLAGAALGLVQPGPKRRPQLLVALLGAAVTSAAVFAFVLSFEPQENLRGDLTDAEVASLPVIDMLNFAYTPARFDIVDGEYLALLVNDTPDPHTFTIDEDGVDLYVPAGRETVLRYTPDGTGQRTFYCAVGDHRALGMVGTVTVLPDP